MPDSKIPFWVNWIPEEDTYRLVMEDINEALQDIDLTRGEFIALKAHLAQLRGYVKPETEVHQHA